MKHIPIIFLVLFIIFINNTITPQYLEVRRTANIKENPTKEGTIIESVDKGTYLYLLENGTQENGYYRVKAKTVNKNGWIYRTLVRRFEGNVPGESYSSSELIKFDPIPSDYYIGIENLVGEELKSALHNIIKDHTEYSYGEVWDILKETDLDSLNPSNVIGLYSGFSMNASLQYDGGKGWTREHVWAKSYGDFGTDIGPGTDLHHLRAEDVSTNSARNNRSFDECDMPWFDTKGKYFGQTSSFTSTSSWVWEPRDEVKGDVARMLFYMDVRYEDDDDVNLELFDNINDKNSKEPLHGKLSTLLKWHENDPVSNYERYRNDIIFKKYQHNRNPFIDHPDFANKIWGSNN